MNSIVKRMSSLCAPSLSFLVVNSIYIIYGIVVSYKSGIYPICFEPERCDIFMTFSRIGLAILLTILFTWILNVICSYGYNVIAWLLFAVILILRHVNGFFIEFTL